MKRSLLIGFLSGLTFSIVLSEPPEWNVNPLDFQYSMTITGVLNMDGVESTDTCDMIGAFINDECRGFVNPVNVEDQNRFIAYLMIYSNNVSDTINFKMYNYEKDKIYEVEKTLIFTVDGIIGSPSAPYIFSSPNLSSEASFLSFSFPGQIRETVMTDSTIQIIMPSGTDLTTLVAMFSTNPGTYVSINGVIQESNITVNDFTTPITYVLLSADESTTSYYSVMVTLEQSLDAANFFSPNGDQINDTWMIRNPELYDNCEFTIYDAMGNKVFHQTGYNNDWEGKYRDRELPNGTYYYIIKCDDTKLSYKGSITLLR
jgi:gliding motility-associated-like protein